MGKTSIALSQAVILEGHLHTIIDLGGMVSHKTKFHRLPVCHAQARIPHCPICRALGLREVRDHAFKEGG